MSNETPIRTVRVNERLWKAAKLRARRNNTTVSEIINEALREFVTKRPS